MKGLQDGVPTKVKQEDDVNEVENGGDNVDGKIDDAFDEKTVVQEPLPYRSFLPTTYNGSVNCRKICSPSFANLHQKNWFI